MEGNKSRRWDKVNSALPFPRQFSKFLLFFSLTSPFGVHGPISNAAPVTEWQCLPSLSTLRRFASTLSFPPTILAHQFLADNGEHTERKLSPFHPRWDLQCDHADEHDISWN